MSAATEGAVSGYSARSTLSLRVELVRQLRRRRTQITLGLLALLPFLLLIAFSIGSGSASRSTGQFVDLATSSGLSFAAFTLFASVGFLLIVVFALFFGDTVASEASWSSLKYLLTIPVPRSRLLRQKATVAASLALLGLIVLPAMALLVGVIAYGGGDLVSPTGQALPFGLGVERLALVVVYIAINLFWVAALALLLSVSTDAPLGAVGGAVLASILSQILNQITALEDLRNYLPTHYAYAWSDLLATNIDWGNVASGALSSLSYGFVFCVFAVRRFHTKDITS